MHHNTEENLSTALLMITEHKPLMYNNYYLQTEGFYRLYMRVRYQNIPLPDRHRESVMLALHRFYVLWSFMMLVK